MSDRLGSLRGKGTRLTLDAGVRSLNPDVILGGSPQRLIRFRAGTSMGTRLAAAESVSASGLAPRTLRRLLDAGVLHPAPTTLGIVADDRLTVVIPIHDRADLLDRALTALGRRFRVLVVDDASSDPHQLDEVAARHRAEILHLAVNVGPGGARNAGLARVETEFVAFVDSDVVAAPESLSMLLRHFADPQVAAVAPRVRALPGSAGGFIERFEAQRPPLDMGEFPALVRPASRVAYVPSACLVARTAITRPGFDESLRTGEDVDLVWRLGQKWLVRYEPSVEVRHSSRQRALDWVRQHYGYGLSASPLHARHGDAVAPARMPRWAGVLVAAVWTAALTCGARRSGGRVATGALAVALGATVVGHAQTRETLGRIAPDVRDHAGPLTATTAAVSLEQSLSLVLRHWVPLSVIGGVLSPRVRLLLGLAALINAWRAHPKSAAQFVTALLGNAVVESAYGTGVWRGVLRGRDLGAVLPTVTDRSDNPTTGAGAAGVSNASGSSASLPNWFEMDAKEHFEAHLAARRFPKGARALQLGAYTGDASVWLMENTAFTLTDVDTWRGSHESAHAELDWAEVEATYDRRTARFRADSHHDPDGPNPRILKVKSASAEFLREERATYSFVYIDAAHDAASVLADGMLTMPLLASGSILAFDDYAWDLGATPLDNPRAGIDKFLEIYGDRFTTLQLDTQVWLQLK